MRHLDYPGIRGRPGGLALPRQPLGQGFLISLAALAEPQRRADLRPMALTRTPAPLVLREQRRIDLTCSAKYATACSGTSAPYSGNLPSISKNLSSAANPNRVAPGLLLINSQSGSINAQDPISIGS
jgi:hypothetical protein